MKQQRIAVLIPTKDRLEDFRIFAESWQNTTEGLSDVIVGVDAGDTSYDEMIAEFGFIKEELEAKPFLYLLNDMAVKYAKEYEYLNFMEDDCTFLTAGWERVFIAKLQEIGEYGIVWGNDLLNGEYIVGLPFMHSKIVDVLGYMSPPEIKYLWADHFWKHLGTGLGTLFYFFDIIVEHRHYSTGKRAIDSVSVEVDSKGAEDFVGYNQHYLPNRLLEDIQKLLNARS